MPFLSSQLEAPLIGQRLWTVVRIMTSTAIH
jgi:hypothetical protein